MKKLIKIGFWRENENAQDALPWPSEFYSFTWIESEKDQVISYIKQAKIVTRYRGSASCRLCGIQLGSSDMSDGVFIFPEGYEHYLEKHNVKPPQTFINYALNK